MSDSSSEEYGWRIVRFIPIGALADELFGGGGPGGGTSFAQLQEFLNGGGNRQRRASQDVIDKLPRTLLHEAEICTVCQDDMMGEVTKMPCDHKYHRDCINPWLAEHNTCPMCRWEVDTDDAEYNRDIVARRERANGEVTRTSASTNTTTTTAAATTILVDGAHSSGEDVSSSSDSSSSSAVASTETSSIPSPTSPRSPMRRARLTRTFFARSASTTTTTTTSTSTTTTAPSSPLSPNSSEASDSPSPTGSQVAFTFAFTSSSSAMPLVLLSLLSFALEAEEDENGSPSPSEPRRRMMPILPLELLFDISTVLAARNRAQAQAAEVKQDDSSSPPAANHDNITTASTLSSDSFLSSDAGNFSPFASNNDSFLSSAFSSDSNSSDSVLMSNSLSPWRSGSSGLASGANFQATPRNNENATAFQERGSSQSDSKSIGDREVKTQGAGDRTSVVPVTTRPSTPTSPQTLAPLPSFEVASSLPTSPRATRFQALRTSFTQRRNTVFRSLQNFVSRRPPST